ncbi:hypothetical protein TTHERM_00310180 (macronuclear) [Tetrahymena thermophila SB210]|uniref:Uncharacterized protein n=1 Tax=Tetrahymena thermophila (strain SB210) TaxID=312017 RepID=I7MG02_TETTS|nr:hypothetical protein TTHERM_00310180 [Tetrahymena thermophila SB210]EAS00849.2 hypothetical protein TTHERM_00310180 [Tetrahymena thermophila SB210]|eukprot:XP_001021094.2 hypothetical protein TTHERM_00310180 [Tetrahymena thermophila SB210]
MFKEIFNQRNSQKRQLSYFIKTNVVVPFVCEDIKNFKPTSLKLDIRSLNKNWQSFVKLMETLQNTSQSIHKLDINLQEFIGPQDVNDIEKIFTKALKNVPQLQTINIRLQFNYLENGGYERDIVDLFLELIEKLLDQNRSLKFQLNIFRICIKRNKNSLEIFSDKIDRKKEYKRNIINKMFKSSKLHEYFLSKFSEIRRIRGIKTLKIDFSNLFLTQKKGKKSVQHIYENEIECLLNGVKQILDRMIPNNYLENLTIQFFSFFFHFEVQPKQQMLLYRFFMNLQLFFQNTPLVSIKNFDIFSGVLNRKLMNKKYIYSSFDGNLFTSKYYNNRKKEIKIANDHIKDIETKRTIFKSVIQNASEFLNLMTNNFENVRKISYFQHDSHHLNKILQYQRQRLTHTICLYKQSWLCLEENKLKILNINQYLDFKRRQFLYFYAKLLRIKKRNKKFSFRKEIISQILKLINLSQDFTDFNINRCYYYNNRKGGLIMCCDSIK